ncbi:alpha/beta hydrolase [Nonlabens antarcticus]|uniref:alpha/beta hydrolase n=1 Tax=Nonlabens antarcticus TaxID=392714 RepID=UPI00189144E0|nr:alpha/beta hydrolase [Nonlabens antarcticus]
MIKFFSFLLNNTAGIFKNWNGRYAFHLLCKVKQVHKEKEPNAFLDAAKQTKLYTDGYEATIYKIGTGPKNLLFLHGWKSHSARWAPIVELLDLEKYTCYAIDAPAHGRSAGDSIHLEIYRKFVVQTIESAGDIHAIVGHSLGALVINYLYLDNPKVAVNKFIITGAPMGMEQIYFFFQRIVGVNPQVMENLDRYVSANITRIPAREIKLDSFFENVKKPVLVIHDEDDKVCDIVPIKESTHGKSNIETFFTQGLGHDLASDAVYKRMVCFMEEEDEYN